MLSFPFLPLNLLTQLSKGGRGRMAISEHPGQNPTGHGYDFPPAAPNRVLLCDDVLTTGSTLENAVRALCAAGVSDIEVCILAIADPAPFTTQQSIPFPDVLSLHFRSESSFLYSV